MHLSVSMSEKEQDVIYNCQVLVGPEGHIEKSRKIHMSEDEGLMYVGGAAMPVFDIGKCKVGTVICYDALFPELTRALALNGAEVFLMPSAGRCGNWNQETEASVARQVKEDWSQDCGWNGSLNDLFAMALNCGPADLSDPDAVLGDPE